MDGILGYMTNAILQYHHLLHPEDVYTDNIK